MSKGFFARVACGIGAACLALAGLGAPSTADERDELVEKQRQQQEQIEAYQSSLEGVDTDLQAVYLKLQETQTQIPIAQAELQSAQNELAAATREQEIISARLEAAQAELDMLEEEVSLGEENIAATRQDLAAVARSQYRGDTIPTTFDMLAGSSSSEDFLDAVSAQRTALRKQSAALSEFQQQTATAKNRQARQVAVEETITELKAEADALVDEKAAKEKAATDKAKALADLEASYSAQSKELESKKAAFEQSIAQVNAAKDETAAQIAAIDEANRRAAEEAQRRAAASYSGSGASGVVTGGSFIIPVIAKPLYVTSPFGMRDYPFGGYYMHNGVDLRSACGSPQVAPGDGTIARVIPAPGNSTHGNQIYINLGYVNGHSWVVVTNHLSGFNVSVGQTVRQGDVIGWTGQTGQVTGCHVHMEVWRDGTVINPMSLPGFN